MAIDDALVELKRALADLKEREASLATELDSVRDQMSRVESAIRALASKAEGELAVVVQHDSKYSKLGENLRNRLRQPVVLTFLEIEGIAGTALPPSARAHEPHWYGYDNSALAKTIRNAGWKARKVNLAAETVELFPVADWEHEMEECPVCFIRRREHRTGSLMSEDESGQTYGCGCGAVWSVNRA